LAPVTEQLCLKGHRLDVNIGLYAWHGNHHVAYITATREREGW
jgi:hypothetical protein